MAKAKRLNPKTLEQAIRWLKVRDKTNEFMRNHANELRALELASRRVNDEISATNSILWMHARMVASGNDCGLQHDSIKTVAQCVNRYVDGIKVIR